LSLAFLKLGVNFYSFFLLLSFGSGSLIYRFVSPLSKIEPVVLNLYWEFKPLDVLAGDFKAALSIDLLTEND